MSASTSAAATATEHFLLLPAQEVGCDALPQLRRQRRALLPLPLRGVAVLACSDAALVLPAMQQRATDTQGIETGNGSPGGWRVGLEHHPTHVGLEHRPTHMGLEHRPTTRSRIGTLHPHTASWLQDIHVPTCLTF